MPIQKLRQMIQELGRKANLRKCCFELLAEFVAVITVGFKHVEGEIYLLELSSEFRPWKEVNMSSKILENGGLTL